MKILKNKILAPYTTFAIGGPADYFCEAKTAKELIEAITWSKQHHLKYYFIGGGSNILISDKGIRGMVIKINPPHGGEKLNPPVGGKNNNEVIGEAGVRLSELIQYASKHSLTGLEFLAGIPGTVGGAIFGNAGPSSASIAQAVKEVKVLGKDNKIYTLTHKECDFSYRHSRFPKSREIILSATFSLKPTNKELIKEKIEKYLQLRRNQPKARSAGSIFKNPLDSKYSSGYLIEQSGLRGKRIGDAMISEQHANWIINLGQAKYQDVIELMALIKKIVKQKYKIVLEEEINILGK